jgi:hypothetical protein
LCGYTGYTDFQQEDRAGQANTEGAEPKALTRVTWSLKSRGKAEKETPSLFNINPGQKTDQINFGLVFRKMWTRDPGGSPGRFKANVWLQIRVFMRLL